LGFYDVKTTILSTKPQKLLITIGLGAFFAYLIFTFSQNNSQFLYPNLTRLITLTLKVVLTFNKGICQPSFCNRIKIKELLISFSKSDMLMSVRIIKPP